MSFEFHLPTLEEMRGTPDGVEMLRMIDDDNFRSALITGCPGSGKTTVSIYRLVRLSSQEVKVRLVTYQNMLVLAIQNLANVQRVPTQQVSTFHRWYCRLTRCNFNTDAPPTPQEVISALDNIGLANHGMEELLIDEGQDLPPCVYDALPRYFRRVFVGADNAQQVHPHHGRLQPRPTAAPACRVIGGTSTSAPSPRPQQQSSNPADRKNRPDA